MSLTNLAGSVQARLQNRARATNRPFQELLQYFAMERFLYRLSKSQRHSVCPSGVGTVASASVTADKVADAAGSPRIRSRTP